MRSCLLLAMVLAGCACVCDLDGAVSARAGAGAVDCGLVALPADRTAALDCAEAAIASGRGFRVGWQAQGTDSEVRVYVAGHDGAFSIFDYDGDPSGGSHACATFFESTCTSAPVRGADFMGARTLTCPSSDRHQVCGR